MDSLITLVVILAVVCACVGVYRFFQYDQGPPDPEEQAGIVQGNYSPNMGKTVAGWKQGKAEARTKLQSALNTEIATRTEGVRHQTVLAAAVIQRREVPDQLREAREREREEHERNILALQNQQTLLREATPLLLDLPTFLEMKKREYFDQLDLKKDTERAKEEARWAFVAKYLTDQHTLLLEGEQLDRLLIREHHIENGDDPEPLKQKRLAAIREQIAALEGGMNVRKQRLLQTPQQGDTGTMDEDTNILRDS